MVNLKKNLIGKQVIVRGDRSGIFYGTITKIMEGAHYTSVCLTNARRCWYWAGACSISQLAVTGPVTPNKCKFTIPVDVQYILDIIEIIPCTPSAINNINEVPEWKI